MSTQFEVRAEVSPEMADRLEAYFLESESLRWGVMQKEREDPFEVFGLFDSRTEAETALARLRAEFPELPGHFRYSRIEDADWQNAYKAFVRPWSDRRLHWIPLWERDRIQPPSDAAVVYLDAGMAFGTGSHETTRLCARRLQDYLEAAPGRAADAEVIDAGCGSGVLAFSAAALGVAKVSGFDYDPEAISVCQSNARENPHLPPIPFEVADLEGGLSGRQADLLLANIQTDVLIPEADHLVCAVKPGGRLALSGILVKELEQVRAVYEARFARHRPDSNLSVDSRTDGEWADLLFMLG